MELVDRLSLTLYEKNIMKNYKQEVIKMIDGSKAIKRIVSISAAVSRRCKHSHSIPDHTEYEGGLEPR